MAADLKAAVRNPGFFARLFGGLISRFRRIFRKQEDPNIYPFF